MAKCKTCGKDVGCGCNLINGQCSTCASTNTNITINPTINAPT